MIWIQETIQGLKVLKVRGMKQITHKVRRPEAQNLSEFSWKNSSMTPHASRRETIGKTNHLRSLMLLGFPEVNMTLVAAPRKEHAANFIQGRPRAEILSSRVWGCLRKGKSGGSSEKKSQGLEKKSWGIKVIQSYSNSFKIIGNHSKSSRSGAPSHCWAKALV